MSSLVDRGITGAELWSSVLAALEPRYSKPVYETWLRPMRPMSITGSEIVLGVATPFAREWVEGRLRAPIVEALRELLGYEIEVRFVVANDVETQEQPQTAPTPATATPRHAASEEIRPGNLNPRYT